LNEENTKPEKITEYSHEKHEKLKDEHVSDLHDASVLPEEIPKEIEIEHSEYSERKTISEETQLPEKEPSQEILPKPEDDGPCEKFSPLIGKPCKTGTPGICSDAAFTCVNRTLACLQITYPKTETCDGKDNDCDGQTDEDFDLQQDKNNCGSCGNVCKGSQMCIYGKCCGSYGVEICGNIIDDNCDGQTDEANCSALEFLLIPDQKDTTKIPDISGKGKHAIIKNGGVVKTYLSRAYFDTSTKGYAVITNISPLQTTSVESFTIIVFAYVTSVPTSGASFIIRSPGTSLNLSHRSKKYVGSCGQGTDSSAPTLFQVNKHIHFAYVYDKATPMIKFYVEGTLDGTAINIKCSPAPLSSYMYISWDPKTGVYTDNHMKARYRSIIYLSRALTDKEISVLYKLRYYH